MPNRKDKCTKKLVLDGRAKRERDRVRESRENNNFPLLNNTRSSVPRVEHSNGQFEEQGVESSDVDQPGPAPTQAMQQGNLYANKYFMHHN